MIKKVQFVLVLLTALMFLNAGLNKIFKYLPVPDDLPEKLKVMNQGFEAITWLNPLLAVVEIVGAILLLIPRFRALGALMLVPVMAGILLVHITAAPAMIALPLILAAILTWVLYTDRAKLLPLIQA